MAHTPAFALPCPQSGDQFVAGYVRKLLLAVSGPLFDMIRRCVCVWEWGWVGVDGWPCAV